jgi:hypothetical protein
MERTEFIGELVADNVVNFSGHVLLEIDSTGKIKGEMQTGLWVPMDALSASEFRITGSIKGKTGIRLESCRATHFEWKASNSGVMWFTAASLHKQNSSTGQPNPQEITVLVYQLTNLVFSGVETTVLPNGSFVRDRLRFTSENLNCTLMQVAGYSELMKELRRTKGSAITALLEISPTGQNQLLDVSEVDDHADAICELLSFATKNTVFWVERKKLANDKIIGAKARSIGKIRPIVTGWSLIPDFVHVSKQHRPELLNFLQQVSAKYASQLRREGLGLAISWLIDSEHQTHIEMKYLAAFIAIEHLRSKFLRKQSPFISVDWHKQLNKTLGIELLEVVEKHLQTPLRNEQKSGLINALRSANSASISQQLESLCNQLGVTGFRKDMATLRNSIVHTGQYSFQELNSIDLYYKLSRILDLCVLKLLEFDGFYHHHETRWRATPVS